MHSDAFDVIPFEVGFTAQEIRFWLTCAQDIKGDWKKLGSGSFGNVYKGE